MKQLMVLVLLTWSSISMIMAQQFVTVRPQEITRLNIREYGEPRLNDPSGPGPEPIVPFFEPERGLVFVMRNGILRYDDSFNPIFTRLSRGSVWSGATSIRSSRLVTISGAIGIGLARYGNTYFEDDNYTRLDRVRNSILLDNMVVRENGSSIVIEPDQSMRLLNPAETRAYALKNIPGATVRDDQLYYRGNVIDKSSYYMIDDDGHFYTSNSMQYNDIYIRFSVEAPPDVSYRFFDHEGNMFMVDIYNPDGAIVFYAGRTWGYRQPARKAVVTSDNLRIRLRSNTNSFILGKMADQEAISILKTGPEETIGGVRAPWYRIQAANGMVGWAFGGFIRILP